MARFLYSKNPTDWHFNCLECNTLITYNSVTRYAKVTRKLRKEQQSQPTCQSCSRQKWISEHAEEFSESMSKMKTTKISQKLDGTLSNNHFTKTKTETEVSDIYKHIGSTASKTKKDLFKSGKLIPWNKGKNFITDSRVKKQSGKNHYRYNTNKDQTYDTIFYNKSYRSMILESQNNKCFGCDSTTALCLHHIDENKQNNSNDNLIFVCRSCHMKIHSNKQYKQKFNNSVKQHKETTRWDILTTQPSQ